eukprot:scaffold1420_cov375-Pavlova_lutheri.AAC.15
MAWMLRGVAAARTCTGWHRLLSTYADPNVGTMRGDGGQGGGGGGGGSRRSREDRRSGGGGGGFLKTSAATIVGRRMAELIEASHPHEAVELFQKWKNGQVRRGNERWKRKTRTTGKEK